jgi:hypothetical protein
MSSAPKGQPDFEREKWEADVRLREREIAVKEAEAAAKVEELKRSRWANPLVLALLAASLAAAGNACVALINGIEQRAQDDRHAIAENQLATTKAEADQRLEEGKAEAARILEVIRTNDPDKTAVNLGFLLDTGLILSGERRKSLIDFLKGRAAGHGPSLPSNTPPPTHWRSISAYMSHKRWQGRHVRYKSDNGETAFIKIRRVGGPILVFVDCRAKRVFAQRADRFGQHLRI